MVKDSACENDLLRSGGIQQDLVVNATSNTLNVDDRMEKSHNSTRASVDETDSVPKSLCVTAFDIICVFVSALTYTVDIGWDIYLAVGFFREDKMWYFGLTMAFFFIPAMVMSGVSLRWYIGDMNKEHLPKVSRTKWVVRGVCLVLLLSPLVRYWDSFAYGMKSKKAMKEKNRLLQEKYYNLMIYEDADAVLLRLFESFMESAPQFILQFYIYKADVSGEDWWTKTRIITGMVVSLLSLASSLAFYHRSMRFALEEKGNMTWKGTVVQFLWYFFINCARLTAMGLFSVYLPGYLALICMVHWVAMGLWITSQKLESCPNKFLQVLFDFMLGFVYIFCFVNVKEEQTRWKYMIYYTVCLVENVILISMWFSYRSHSHWHNVLWLVGNILSFFLGIAFMAVYYKACHPMYDQQENRQEIEKYTKEHSIKRSLSVKDTEL